jgi:hypothetical protein
LSFRDFEFFGILSVRDFEIRDYVGDPLICDRKNPQNFRKIFAENCGNCGNSATAKLRMKTLAEIYLVRCGKKLVLVRVLKTKIFLINFGKYFMIQNGQYFIIFTFILIIKVLFCARYNAKSVTIRET